MDRIDMATLQTQLMQLNREVADLKGDVARTFEMLCGVFWWYNSNIKRERYRTLQSQLNDLDARRKVLEEQLPTQRDEQPSCDSPGCSPSAGIVSEVPAMYIDTTADVLRKILPVGVVIDLQQLPSKCEAGLQADGQRVLLPVFPWTYSTLVQQKKDWESWLEPVEVQNGCRSPLALAQHIGAILTRQHSQTDTELIMPAICADIIHGTMQLAATFLAGTTTKRHGDQDESTSTQSSRSRLLGGRTMVKGEHKPKDDQLEEARQDLVKKHNDWSNTYRGMVPYLPCYAAAGKQVDFCAIPRSGKGRLVTLMPTLSVDDAFHRMQMIHVALMFYCITEGLVNLVSKDAEVGQVQARPYGTTITLWGSYVIKEVDLKQHAFLAVTGKRMKKVYNVKSRYLVEAEQGYPKVSETNKYILKLTPRGQSLDNCRDLPKCAAEAFRCILSALVALHEAGFGHGDLNWSNVIIDSQGVFRLIDLESTIALHDRQEQQKLLRCGLRPVAWGDNLEAWEDDRDGKIFTAASDLYMLCFMMQRFPSRTHGVPYAVVQGLLDKRWSSAQDVLAALGYNNNSTPAVAAT